MATNQHFPQDNTAQSLKPEDVSSLKSQCSGEEVVAALVSNSATFGQKTKFSQEKYLAKKGRKHIQQVVLLPPSAMELCETYLRSSRQRACGLRFEQLSAILCQADVRCGGRFLVLDGAQGLVAGAMAQRLGGLGRVYRLFSGGCSDKGVLELDLPPLHAAAVRALPLQVLALSEPLQHDFCAEPFSASAEAPRADGGLGSCAEAPASAEEAQRRQARRRRAAQRRADVADLCGSPVDGLVVVESDQQLAAEALRLGLERLGPGGRLAVFGPALQPLAERQAAMRAQGFVDVRLAQLFTREYQVLPQRTHPQMQDGMHLCDGFLLTGTKLGTCSARDGGGPGAKRSRTE